MSGLAPYLQLLSLQDRRIAFGVATVTWPGGSHRANNMTIAHGLGRTPAAVLLTMQDSAEFSVAEQWQAPDGTNFYPTAYAVDGTNPGIAVQSACHWIAIG